MYPVLLSTRTVVQETSHVLLLPLTVDDIIIHVEEVANDVSVVVVRWILLCPEYTQNGSYYVVELA